MSAIDDSPADLTKVDSAVSGLSSSPTEHKIGHRRASSSVAGVFNINDLGNCLDPFLSLSRRGKSAREHVGQKADIGGTEKEGKELEIAKETQKLNW